MKLSLALLSFGFALAAFIPAHSFAADNSQKDHPAAVFVQKLGDTALMDLTDQKLQKDEREKHSGKKQFGASQFFAANNYGTLPDDFFRYLIKGQRLKKHSSQLVYNQSSLPLNITFSVFLI